MTQPDSHSAVKRFYDQKRYGSVVDGENPLPWHSRKIAKRLGVLEGTKVLDIACGTGEWLAQLQRLGAKIAGVDISDNAIEACCRKFPDSEFRSGVAEDLPFQSESFDLITCLGSLEHFLDQKKALQEMRRVAKPKAKFLILVPNSGFLTRQMGLYKGTEQTQIREVVLSIGQWTDMFNEAGLKVDAKWRDLHMLNPRWIFRKSFLVGTVRLLQATALLFWPIRWQYQVYFFCTAAGNR